MNKASGPKSSLPTPEASGPVFVPVGEVVGIFGLKGWIKVRPLTEFAERFDPGASLNIGSDVFRVTDVGWKEAQVRLKLEGIDTPEAAESLRGAILTAPKDEHPELDEDEYYTADLIGLEVVDEEGSVLGKVDEVLPAPAQDLLKVGAVLIPVVRDFVREVSLEEGRIVVRLIPGMLPSSDDEGKD